MNYLDLLISSSKKFQSIVSLGLDPVIEDIPISSGNIKDRIYTFYETILNRIIQKKVYPGAVKPNYAFYAQYGIEGIEALVSVIELFKSQDFPIILDVKRGDIEKTAAAYSKEAFDFFKADAVTLSPFLGIDSINPFMKNYPGRGYYILNKTSNKSSVDIQDILINGEPLFIHVSKKIIEWYQPGIGSVIGATYPEELSSIVDIFKKEKHDIPLLIPGVGSQKGSLQEVCSILKEYSTIGIHRINSSSAINYAYKKKKNIHFAEAAINALEELNNEIGINI